MVLGFIGFVCLNYFAPDYYFKMYPLIPLLFIILLTVSYITLIIIKKRKAIICMITYSVMRSIKLFICLILVLLYFRIIDCNNLSFALVFMFFYIVYLKLATWAVIKIFKQ